MSLMYQMPESVQMPSISKYVKDTGEAIRQYGIQKAIADKAEAERAETERIARVNAEAQVRVYSDRIAAAQAKLNAIMNAPYPDMGYIGIPGGLSSSQQAQVESQSVRVTEEDIQKMQQERAKAQAEINALQAELQTKVDTAKGVLSEISSRHPTTVQLPVSGVAIRGSARSGVRSTEYVTVGGNRYATSDPKLKEVAPELFATGRGVRGGVIPASPAYKTEKQMGAVTLGTGKNAKGIIVPVIEPEAPEYVTVDGNKYVKSDPILKNIAPELYASPVVPLPEQVIVNGNKYNNSDPILKDVAPDLYVKPSIPFTEYVTVGANKYRTDDPRLKDIAPDRYVAPAGGEVAVTMEMGKKGTRWATAISAGGRGAEPVAQEGADRYVTVDGNKYDLEDPKDVKRLKERHLGTGGGGKGGTTARGGGGLSGDIIQKLQAKGINARQWGSMEDQISDIWYVTVGGNKYWIQDPKLGEVLGGSGKRGRQGERLGIGQGAQQGVVYGDGKLQAEVAKTGASLVLSTVTYVVTDDGGGIVAGSPAYDEYVLTHPASPVKSVVQVHYVPPPPKGGSGLSEGQKARAKAKEALGENAGVAPASGLSAEEIATTSGEEYEEAMAEGGGGVEVGGGEGGEEYYAPPAPPEGYVPPADTYTDLKDDKGNRVFVFDYTDPKTGETLPALSSAISGTHWDTSTGKYTASDGRLDASNPGKVFAMGEWRDPTDIVARTWLGSPAGKKASADLGWVGGMPPKISTVRPVIFAGTLTALTTLSPAQKQVLEWEKTTGQNLPTPLSGTDAQLQYVKDNRPAGYVWDERSAQYINAQGYTDAQHEGQVNIGGEWVSLNSNEGQEWLKGWAKDNTNGVAETTGDWDKNGNTVVYYAYENPDTGKWTYGFSAEKVTVTVPDTGKRDANGRIIYEWMDKDGHTGVSGAIDTVATANASPKGLALDWNKIDALAYQSVPAYLDFLGGDVKEYNHYTNLEDKQNYVQGLRINYAETHVGVGNNEVMTTEDYNSLPNNQKVIVNNIGVTGLIQTIHDYEQALRTAGCWVNTPIPNLPAWGTPTNRIFLTTTGKDAEQHASLEALQAFTALSKAFPGVMNPIETMWNTARLEAEKERTSGEPHGYYDIYSLKQEDLDKNPQLKEAITFLFPNVALDQIGRQPLDQETYNTLLSRNNAAEAHGYEPSKYHGISPKDVDKYYPQVEMTLPAYMAKWDEYEKQGYDEYTVQRLMSNTVATTHNPDEYQEYLNSDKYAVQWKPTLWQSMTPWAEEKGETVTLAGAMTMVADALVPFYYTSRTWAETSIGDKILNIFIDGVSIIPIAGRGAAAARMVETGSMSARAMAVAKAMGREAVAQVVAPVTMVLHPIGMGRGVFKTIRDMVASVTNINNIPNFALTCSDPSIRMGTEELIDLMATPEGVQKIRDVIMEMKTKGLTPELTVWSSDLQRGFRIKIHESQVGALFGAVHASMDITPFAKKIQAIAKESTKGLVSDYEYIAKTYFAPNGVAERIKAGLPLTKAQKAVQKDFQRIHQAMMNLPGDQASTLDKGLFDQWISKREAYYGVDDMTLLVQKDPVNGEWVLFESATDGSGVATPVNLSQKTKNAIDQTRLAWLANPTEETRLAHIKVVDGAIRESKLSERAVAINQRGEKITQGSQAMFDYSYAHEALLLRGEFDGAERFRAMIANDREYQNFLWNRDYKHQIRIKGKTVQPKPQMAAKEQGVFVSGEFVQRFATGGSAHGGGVIPKIDGMKVFFKDKKLVITGSTRHMDWITKFPPDVVAHLDLTPIRGLDLLDCASIPTRELADEMKTYIRANHGVIYGSLNEYIKLPNWFKPHDIDLVFADAEKAIADIEDMFKAKGYKTRPALHGFEYQIPTPAGAEEKWVKAIDVASTDGHVRMKGWEPAKGDMIDGIEVEPIGEQYLSQIKGVLDKGSKALVRLEKVNKSAKAIREAIERAGADPRRPGAFFMSTDVTKTLVPSEKLYKTWNLNKWWQEFKVTVKMDKTGKELMVFEKKVGDVEVERPRVEVGEKVTKPAAEYEMKFMKNLPEYDEAYLATSYDPLSGETITAAFDKPPSFAQKVWFKNMGFFVEPWKTPFTKPISVKRVYGVPQAGDLILPPTPKQREVIPPVGTKTSPTPQAPATHAPQPPHVGEPHVAQPFDTNTKGWLEFDSPEEAARGTSTKKPSSAKVVLMTPEKYFKESGTLGRGIKVEDIKKLSGQDRVAIDAYKEEILAGKRPAMPSLNYTQKMQEGLHRAIAAFELGYKEIPVVVVTAPKQIDRKVGSLGRILGEETAGTGGAVATKGMIGPYASDAKAIEATATGKKPVSEVLNSWGNRRKCKSSGLTMVENPNDPQFMYVFKESPEGRQAMIKVNKIREGFNPDADIATRIKYDTELGEAFGYSREDIDAFIALDTGKATPEETALAIQMADKTEMGRGMGGEDVFARDTEGGFEEAIRRLDKMGQRKVAKQLWEAARADAQFRQAMELGRDVIDIGIEAWSMDRFNPDGTVKDEYLEFITGQPREAIRIQREERASRTGEARITRTTRVPREPRAPRETRAPREPRAPRAPRETRAPRERVTRVPRAPRIPKEPRVPRTPRVPRIPRIPRIPRVPKKPRPPIIIFHGKKKLTRGELEASVAWKQGIMYKLIYPPYGQRDIINSRTPFPGMHIHTGVRSAFETLIRTQRGRLPSTIVRDMGMMSIRIEAGDKYTGKPKLKFHELEERKGKGTVKTQESNAQGITKA